MLDILHRYAVRTVCCHLNVNAVGIYKCCELLAGVERDGADFNNP